MNEWNHVLGGVAVLVIASAIGWTTVFMVSSAQMRAEIEGRITSNEKTLKDLEGTSKKIAEDVNSIRHEMATKEDVKALDDRISEETKTLNSKIDELSNMMHRLVGNTEAFLKTEKDI